MQIYDWIVLVIALAIIARGWLRGAVREAIDAGLLLVGTLIVFRLSPMIGSILSGMANIPYEVGKVVAGGLIFVALVVGSILLGRVVAAALHVVPGASLLNKVGGAAAGLVYAVIVVALGTTLFVAAPMPSAWRDPVENSVQSSLVGGVLVDPGGPTQTVVAVASGEQIFGRVIAVREAIGDRLMAGTVPIPFPSVDDAVLAPTQTSAQHVFDEINRVRIEEGIDPLAWSSDLAIVAVSRSTGVYRSGVLVLDSELGSALAAAQIPGTINGELVVLAASDDGLVEAVVSAAEYRRLVTDPAFRKAGIGVVEGPYGLIAVQVLSA